MRTIIVEVPEKKCWDCDLLQFTGEYRPYEEDIVTWSCPFREGDITEKSVSPRPTKLCRDAKVKK